MGTDTMIHIHALLTCEYKKYMYSLLAGIHLQYSFPNIADFIGEYLLVRIFLTSLLIQTNIM